MGRTRATLMYSTSSHLGRQARIAATWVVHRLRRREKSTKPYHLEEGEVVTKFPFRISPNPGTKSVKEKATKHPAFANPETVFVRKQCCNVKSKTTLGNGYLSSRIDEELAPQAFWPRACLLGCHKSLSPHPLEDMGRKLISHVLPTRLAKIRAKDARSILTCSGEFNSRHIVRCSGPKALDDPKSSTRPQVRRDHPLSLSISISGGKDTKKDSLSNGERTGKSPT
ncbi:hypothetical protein YC2023_108200 [Brassica napus]